MRHNHPIIEIIHAQQGHAEKLDRRTAQADLGRRAIQAVIGGRAFRKYHALSETVGLNRAGNLRGMVVSAKMRTMFRYSSDVGEYMENLGYLTTFAAETAKSAPQIESILDSDDPKTLKGMKLAALSGTVAQRTLLGVVPAGAHLVYRSLEGWCMVAGLAGGNVQLAALEGIRTLHRADAYVTTAFEMITDTSNQSNVLWWVIDLLAHPRR